MDMILNKVGHVDLGSVHSKVKEYWCAIDTISFITHNTNIFNWICLIDWQVSGLVHPVESQSVNHISMKPNVFIPIVTFLIVFCFFFYSIVLATKILQSIVDEDSFTASNMSSNICYLWDHNTIETCLPVDQLRAVFSGAEVNLRR